MVNKVVSIDEINALPDSTPITLEFKADRSLFNGTVESKEGKKMFKQEGELYDFDFNGSFGRSERFWLNRPSELEMYNTAW